MRPLIACLALVAATAAAAKEPLPQKFKVQGDVLIFDTESGIEGEAAEITNSDIEVFRRVLQEYPDLREVQLNSSGGSVYAGEEIAWMLMDYGLSTLVDGECVSACVDIFLAGERRRMTLGSKIGFHQRSWSPQAVHSYYRDRRDAEDWATPFEFGSWIYEDTQREVYDHLAYMVERGVTPGFAIETMKTGPDGEWYPSRMQLIAGGVLREEAVSQ